MNKMGVFYFCTMLFRFKKKKRKKEKRKKLQLQQQKRDNQEKLEKPRETDEK